MRKLAWLIIILFSITFIIAVACATFPETIRPAVVDFIFTVGGGIATHANSGLISLGSLLATSNTNLILYSLGLIVFGGIFWVGIKKLFWDKPKAWLNRGKQKVIAAKQLYQDKLSEPELYTNSPTVSPTPPKKEIEETATTGE